MDKQTGLNLDEIAHIRQSITDILQTPIGTRVMRRDYGSQLFELLDRPIDAVLLMQIAAASVIALKQWEKRVEITQFQPQFDSEKPNALSATLTFVHKQSQNAITLDNLNLK